MRDVATVMTSVMFSASNFLEEKNLLSSGVVKLHPGLTDFIQLEVCLKVFFVVRNVASLSDHCGVLMVIELNVDLLSIPKEENILEAQYFYFGREGISDKFCCFLGEDIQVQGIL